MQSIIWSPDIWTLDRGDEDIWMVLCLPESWWVVAGVQRQRRTRANRREPGKRKWWTG